MLDDLVAVIETLKSRIGQHRTDLQKNEIRTRVSLIDPLLAALGWDVADPALVTPEYETGNGRADYALLADDAGSPKPILFIEAKKLGESLTTHRSQMVTYANQSGVPYAGLTDGDKWEIYTVFDPKPIEDRLVLDVSIARTPAPQCALKLLKLWKPNLNSGQPDGAEQPLFWPQISETRAEFTPLKEPAQETPAKVHGWTALKGYIVEKNTKPSHVRLPDGSELPINSWRSLFKQVAEWLIGRGELTQGKCPVLRTNNPSGRCIVNTQPQHPSGTRFRFPAQLSNGLYLNVHFSAQNMVEECTRLLAALGHDPSRMSITVT